LKLVTYLAQGRAQIGALWGNQIVDLKRADRAANGAEEPFPDTMIALLEQGDRGLARARAAVEFVQGAEIASPYLRQLESVTLLAPVLRPVMVIAVGLNYAEHIQETGSVRPDYPMFFHKTAGSLLGAGGTILIPPIAKQVDYEGELAVIIGKTARHVAPGRALDYVAGYANANDISARDLQYRTKQYASGKMPDTFCPLGPALVTRDEIADPNDLTLTTTLNGAVMQQASTGAMIFDVAALISTITEFATLHPGDVILTGTPEGVGHGRTPPVYLKAGDVVTVEVEGLGLLTNIVADESIQAS
jgi:2-keto-4-pentenoate hydratase/2-oxohepta-3-ene-1,7-dioic acid hydratase in catechol pathway